MTAKHQMSRETHLKLAICSIAFGHQMSIGVVGLCASWLDWGMDQHCIYLHSTMLYCPGVVGLCTLRIDEGGHLHCITSKYEVVSFVVIVYLVVVYLSLYIHHHRCTATILQSNYYKNKNNYNNKKINLH